MICTCLRCGTVKRFPTKKQYKLWSECDDACLEVLEETTCTESAAIPLNEPTKSKSSDSTFKDLGNNKKSVASQEKVISDGNNG